MDKPLVLIAALNWGLGHASRCIPVVMAFQKNGFEPVICGNGDSFTILKNEFPNLRSYLLPSYSIRYPENPRHFAMKMLCHLPRFFSAIRKDKKRLRQIVKEIKPSVIFSDNRYGFYHPEVFSVLLTHQVEPVIPVKSKFIRKLFYTRLFKMMRKFQEVWVPDFPGEPSLSGQLSHQHSFDGRVTYCGPLSRFFATKTVMKEKLFDILVIVSGPEPHRSMLEQFALNTAASTNKKICVIAGKPEHYSHYTKNNLTYFSHLPASEFCHCIESSDIVLARAGYSTIMDMFVIGKKALIIPTPGQTEQIYLARHNSGNGLFLEFNPETDSLSDSITKLLSEPYTPLAKQENTIDTPIRHLRDK